MYTPISTPITLEKSCRINILLSSIRLPYSVTVISFFKEPWLLEVPTLSVLQVFDNKSRCGQEFDLRCYFGSYCICVSHFRGSPHLLTLVLVLSQ